MYDRLWKHLLQDGAFPGLSGSGNADDREVLGSLPKQGFHVSCDVILAHILCNFGIALQKYIIFLFQQSIAHRFFYFPTEAAFFYAQTEQKSNSQPLYKIPVKRQA